MSLNVQTILAEDVIPWLHAAGTGDLVWWTETELYALADEEFDRMARERLFVERDSIVVVADTGVYALPTRHVETLYAFYTPSGATPRALESTTPAELTAESETWPSDTDTMIQRFTQDVGLDQITVHPKLLTGMADGLLDMVFARHQSEITALAPTVTNIPACFRPLVALAVLERAAGKDGEASMPEVAKAIQPFLGVLRDTAMRYFA